MAKDKGGLAALVLLGLGAGGVALYAASKTKPSLTLEERTKRIKELEKELPTVTTTRRRRDLTRQIKQMERKLPTTTPIKTQATKIAGLIRFYAKTFKIPENLLFAIIKIESNFNPNAVNRSARAAKRGNAWGLGQITLATARDILRRYPKTSKRYFPQYDGTGKGLLNPETNIAMTAFHLERLQNKFKRAKYLVLVTGLAHQQGSGNMIKILRRAPNRDITKAKLPPNGKRYFAKLKSLLPDSLLVS